MSIEKKEAIRAVNKCIDEIDDKFDQLKILVALTKSDNIDTVFEMIRDIRKDMAKMQDILSQEKEN